MLFITSEPRGKRAEALRGGRYCLIHILQHVYDIHCMLIQLNMLFACACSVKQVSFYDDDVLYWKLWHNRTAAAEAPSAVNNVSSAFSSPAPSTKGRHFLVVCCENKAIFLDLVTMRGRDVPKQDLDNRSLLWQVLNLSLYFSRCKPLCLCHALS